jgi:hypothetical protein
MVIHEYEQDLPQTHKEHVIIIQLWENEKKYNFNTNTVMLNIYLYSMMFPVSMFEIMTLGLCNYNIKITKLKKTNPEY